MCKNIQKDQVISEESKYVINTYGRVPAVLVKGEGMNVYDIEGKKYTDFLAGISVNNVGHCHPKVVETIKKQAETLIHVSIV